MTNQVKKVHKRLMQSISGVLGLILAFFGVNQVKTDSDQTVDSEMSFQLMDRVFADTPHGGGGDGGCGDGCSGGGGDGGGDGGGGGGDAGGDAGGGQGN